MNDWRTSVAYRLFGTTSGHRLMSFVGLLSIAGLALAVAVLVMVLSVVNGFERELRERVLGVLPHGTIYFRSPPVDWEAARAEILQHPEVIGAAPVVEGAGIAMKDGRLQGVQFKGVDPDIEPEVSILPSYITSGSLASLAQERFSVMLGEELAGSLGVSVGDSITIVLPDVRFTLAGPVVTTRKLYVTGLFSVGADLDSRVLLMSLDAAKKLKRQDHVDGVVIRLNDLFDTSLVLHELSLTSREEVMTSSWMRQNGSLYEAIGTQKATMFLLLLILVAVAAFNLVSNLVMTVDDNRSEIAILKTMGASQSDVRTIFLYHGLMVCLIGLGTGLITGLALTATLSGLYASLTELLNLDLMSEYFIRYLPTDIRALDIAAISVVSFLICLVATIYPSSKAAATNPIEVLSSEY